MGNTNFIIADDGTIIRDGGVGSDPKPPQKSKMWLIILLLFLVSGGGIIVNYYFSNQNPTEQPPMVILSDFPNEQRIKDFIYGYYSIFENKEYYKLDGCFAEIVPVFFKKTNVTRTEIKEESIKYHEKNLKTKSISFSIRWNTFEQTKISSDIVTVNFIMNYYLNTERFGNQKYVLKIKMDINSDYKIVRISEETIERQNL